MTQRSANGRVLAVRAAEAECGRRVLALALRPRGRLIKQVIWKQSRDLRGDLNLAGQTQEYLEGAHVWPIEKNHAALGATKRYPLGTQDRVRVQYWVDLDHVRKSLMLCVEVLVQGDQPSVIKQRVDPEKMAWMSE